MKVCLKGLYCVKYAQMGPDGDAETLSSYSIAFKSKFFEPLASFSDTKSLFKLMLSHYSEDIILSHYRLKLFNHLCRKMFPSGFFPLI